MKRRSICEEEISWWRGNLLVKKRSPGKEISWWFLWFNIIPKKTAQSEIRRWHAAPYSVSFHQRFLKFESNAAHFSSQPHFQSFQRIRNQGHNFFSDFNHNFFKTGKWSCSREFSIAATLEIIVKFFSWIHSFRWSERTI